MDDIAISYLHGWTERDDLETPSKGWRDDVMVQIPDGRRFRFSFWDPIRLQQRVKDEGRLIERNVVVVRQVSRPVIEGLLRELFVTGTLTDLYMAE